MLSILRFCNVVAAETYDSTCKLADIVVYKCRATRRYFKTRRYKKSLLKQMDNANSYAEWKQCAEEYDKILDIKIWKETHESSDYDWEYIQHLIQVLYESRTSGDHLKLVHVIRSNAVRNIANILDPALYQQTYTGTKYLVEAFQQEYVDCLDYIANLPEDKMPRHKKLDFLAETRHAYGRTALIFSGGANIGLYHYGVLKALYEEKLLPRIVAGSSAGSIFAAFFCVRPLDELPYLLRPDNIKLGAFHKRNKKTTALRRLGRLINEGYLLDVSIIKDFMKENIGDITFQEAYDKTGWILNITVSGYEEHECHRILNYLTAPNVLIWSAVAASCGVPYVYGPVNLQCKNERNEIIPYIPGNRKFVDGSIGNDLPTQQLSEMFNVNYFIVSQTNFWIVPFLNNSEQSTENSRNFLTSFFEFSKNMIGSELKHRVNQLAMLGLFSKAMTRYFNLLTQQYSGDITIWPEITWHDFVTILDGPTSDMLRHCLVNGSRRTYRKISHISATLMIERALEKNYLKVRNSEVKRTKVAKRVKPEQLRRITENDHSDSESIDIEKDSFISDNIDNDSFSVSSYSRTQLEPVKTRTKSFNVPRCFSSYFPQHQSQEDLELIKYIEEQKK